MGIGNAIKAFVTNPKNLALGAGGALVGSTLNQTVDNVTASPDIVVVSQNPNPTGTPNNSTEGTPAWAAAMMLLNGTGGYNGTAGMGGNTTDNPRLINTESTRETLPIVPIICGIIVIGVILYVVLGKKSKRGKR